MIRKEVICFICDNVAVAGESKSKLDAGISIRSSASILFSPADSRQTSGGAMELLLPLGLGRIMHTLSAGVPSARLVACDYRRSVNYDSHTAFFHER